LSEFSRDTLISLNLVIAKLTDTGLKVIVSSTKAYNGFSFDNLANYSLISFN